MRTLAGVECLGEHPGHGLRRARARNDEFFSQRQRRKHEEGCEQPKFHHVFDLKIR